MTVIHQNMLPSMVSVARQLIAVLGLLAVILLGGGYYFYRQIERHQEISDYTSTETLLISEIAVAAGRLSNMPANTDISIGGMAYAQLTNALDAMEKEHFEKEKLQEPLMRASSSGANEAAARHHDNISSFIRSARDYLNSGGKKGGIPSQDYEIALANLETITSINREAEQRAILNLAQFSIFMFAAIAATLVWQWFSRVQPLSRSAEKLALKTQEIEQRLVAEEERAKAMLQFSTDAVISFDERGIIESFNLSAESVFGYEADEILGRPVKLLMSEDAAFYKLTHFRNFKPRDLANLANGISMKGKRKNGEDFQARLIANEVWSKGRRGFVAIIHDLTDEIAAQDQLQESLERFDLCVRGSESAIWDIDLRIGSMFIAPRLMQLLGYDEHDLIVSFSRVLQLVHPDDREAVRKQAETRDNGNSSGFESRFRMRDSNGDYRWFQNKGAYRRDGNGEVVRAAGSITEITAQVKAEEELRQHRDHLVKMVDAQTRQIKKTEARLATAISGISEALCLVDENKLIVLVNRHMLDMYPEVSEIMNPGVSLDDIFIELLEKNRSNSARINFITEHFAALRGDAPSQELRMPQDGWMRITRARTQDGGEIILHTDIAHYKDQEARLQSQARELEHALSMEKEINNLHKQFVTMASHEFRTPLAIIDGAAQFLSREADKLPHERIVQRAEKIRGAVSRMTKLIESTLTVARLDAGKIEIEPGPCNLRVLIMDVCERQQELSSSHRLNLELDDLPDSILADNRAMDQVLTNLISNAVKYSPNSPEIRVRGWRAGGNVLVAVRDHGLGISEEDAPKIFSRFFRAQNSTGIVGTGIGLNLVKELVDLHGGAVHMESRVGLGSTFTIRLPIQGPPSATAKGLAMAATG